MERTGDSLSLTFLLSHEERPFIRGHVVLDLTFDYPHRPPLFRLTEPRGIDPPLLLSRLSSVANARIGNPMLFDLLQEVLNVVSDTCVPSSGCPICLDDFTDDGPPYETPDCLHCAHAHCLRGALRHQHEQFLELRDKMQADMNARIERRFVCPLCRAPLGDAVVRGAARAKEAPGEEMGWDALRDEAVKEHVKRLREAWQPLMERQKSVGGIIDPDEVRTVRLTDTLRPVDGQ